LNDPSIFPADRRIELLAPHFIGQEPTESMLAASEASSNDEVAADYGRFVQAREAAIIDEIRRMCGVTSSESTLDEDVGPDEIAPDVEMETTADEVEELGAA
jgi:hypothetical protein